MEHIAVLNNYLKYSSNDNTVHLSFKVLACMAFHAAVSIKCCVGKDMIWFHFSSFFESY